MNNIPLVISSPVRTVPEEDMGVGGIPVQALAVRIIGIDQPEILRGVSELLGVELNTIPEGQIIVGAIGGGVAMTQVVKAQIGMRIIEIC